MHAKRKLNGLILASLVASFAAWSAPVDHPYGNFQGPLDIRMHSGSREGTLLAPFVYIDPRGKSWTAPKGAVVDGASIPKVFWSLVGGPWDDKYREASVVHDYYCDTRSEPWKEVHRAFYEAMLANGVDSTKAKIMYAAVYRFGPRWNFTYMLKCRNCAAAPYRVDSYEARYVKSEFEDMREAIEKYDLSIEQIEAGADAALSVELSRKRLGAPVLVQ